MKGEYLIENILENFWKEELNDVPEADTFVFYASVSLVSY